MSQLSHAEQCKTLAEKARLGALSTLSSEVAAGFPYGSLVQCASDPEGHPLFFLSDLAEHTRNLRNDPRASLLLWQEQAGFDPLASPRVTLLGRLEAAADELLELYLEAHPQARMYASFKDFHLWSLRVSEARYVGGFGEMSWVKATDYLAAQADPVSKFAESVIEHMNDDHAEALHLLAAQHLGQAPERVSMVYCDGWGYRLQVSGGKQIPIGFSRRLESADEVRQEFVRQVRAAREH